jgi:signal transduction histidine kinase
VVVLLGASAVAFVLRGFTTPVAGPTVAALGVAGAAAVIALVVGVMRADGVTTAWYRAVNAQQATQRRQFDALRASVGQSQTQLVWLLDRVRRGERPAPSALPALPVDTDDQMVLLYDAVNQAHHAAQVALVQASVLAPAPGSVGNVEVFVDFSHRLQSLVHRAIRELDDLERRVEDPDLLNGLFHVDHLATRIRRHAENLAVLGGADSRRQWTTPQALTEVLRSAIAEVEHYSRVKLVPPIEGTLQGHAIADVIHLVAELIENATTFSAPHTDVLMRVQTVTAGLVIEVEDRGLGMMRDEQHRVNGLLADPQQIDLAELLRDGRLGLYVVSMIARRHGIKAQLQTNIFGGIQAIVILPHGLLGPLPRDHESSAAFAPPAVLPLREPVAALAATRAELTPSTSTPGPATDAAVVIPTYVVVPRPVVGGIGVPEPARGARSSAPAPGANHATETQMAMPGQRPPLPQRVGQTHLAPELRQPAAAPPLAEAGTDHDPQLMADFQRGFGEAESDAVEQNNSVPGHTDSVS